jgi:transcriptional regulator with XRE-family HTH domain
MLSGDIIRDARLRAGLSQTELGQRVGRDRTQIARWERHAVAPSLETLRELVQACGYDLSLRLEPLDRSDDEVLRAALMLSPQERLQRMLKQRSGSKK